MDRSDFISEFLMTGDPAGFLRDCRRDGVVEALFPELAALWGPEGAQDVNWHPEGNVWQHVLLVVDGVRAVEDGTPRVRLRLVGLFHDVGKPLAQRVWPSGGISHRGHAEVGARIWRDEIVPGIGVDEALARDVFEMIYNHDLMHMHPAPSEPDASRNRRQLRPDVTEMILGLPTFRELVVFERLDAYGTARTPEACEAASAARFWAERAGGGRRGGGL